MSNESRSTTDNANLQRRLDDVLRQQRELLGGLQFGQSRFKMLARSVWRVQEQEQRKLARELHDGVGQNLGAIASLLERAMQEPSLEVLQRAHALATSTLAETRALSRLLRPQILDDLGLEPALHWLVRSIGEAHGLEVNLSLPDALPELDEDHATLVFRTVQEGLANIARHAHARRADVNLQVDGMKLRLKVRDDGQGCDAAAALVRGASGCSSGLGGMRDRLGLYDGEMAIHSIPGQGFVLTATIPLPQSGACI